MKQTIRTISIEQKMLHNNDQAAAENRHQFDSHRLSSINLMAAPGAGKTSFIQQTIQALPQHRIAVIEGDIAGSIDAQKVLSAGAREAVQINTGGKCHLEASMLQQALAELELSELDLVFIENVGNLICTTAWDLGESLKLCLVSAAEGDDKPIKYPGIFVHSDVIVLNKIDLIEMVDFDRDQFYTALRALNPIAPVFEVSSRNGQGFDSWTDWLVTQELHSRKHEPSKGSNDG